MEHGERPHGRRTATGTCVTTTDVAGNSLTSAAISITVDNTAPTLSAAALNLVNLATADLAALTATAGDGAGSGVASVTFEQCNEGSATCTSDTPDVARRRHRRALRRLLNPLRRGRRPAPARHGRRQRGQDDGRFVLVTLDRARLTGTVTPPANLNLRGVVTLAGTASDSGTATGVNTVTSSACPRAPDLDARRTDYRTVRGRDHDHMRDGLYDLRSPPTSPAMRRSSPATIQIGADNTNLTGRSRRRWRERERPRHDRADERGTTARPRPASGIATIQFQRSPAGASTWTNQAASFDTTALATVYDLRVVTTDNAGNGFSPPRSRSASTTRTRWRRHCPRRRRERPCTTALTSNSADAVPASPPSSSSALPAPAPGRTRPQPTPPSPTASMTSASPPPTTPATPSSSAITIRVDNTNLTGTLTAPVNGAEIGVAPVALTSNSADAGGSGSRRSSSTQPGTSHVDGDPGHLEHGERPRRRRRRLLRPARDDDGQRRQRLHLGRDHRPRRRTAPTTTALAPGTGTPRSRSASRRATAPVRA